MPDIYNMPTEAECIARLEVCTSDAPTAALLSQIGGLLSGVIAEFQSPVGEDGSGGTGRQFVPTSETRIFDGSGQGHLQVDEIVPGSTLTVTVYGVQYTDAILSNEFKNDGHSTIVRPTFAPATLAIAYLGRQFIFPRGIQNISVTASGPGWGYAATAPDDVREAILGEVVSRALMLTVNVAGAGVSLKLADYEINTSSGVSIAPLTSPLLVQHRIYLDTIERYRLPKRYQAGRMLKRMF